MADFSNGMMNARLNQLKERLARLQQTTDIRTPATASSTILMEERRKTELLQQMRDAYKKPQAAAAPVYFVPPMPYASEPPKKSSRLSEIMEAMLMQNAQVFQMMQQQMLLNNANKPQTIVEFEQPFAQIPTMLPPLTAPHPPVPYPTELPPLRPREDPRNSRLARYFRNEYMVPPDPRRQIRWIRVAHNFNMPDHEDD